MTKELVYSVCKLAKKFIFNLYEITIEKMKIKK